MAMASWAISPLGPLGSIGLQLAPARSSLAQLGHWFNLGSILGFSLKNRPSVQILFEFFIIKSLNIQLTDLMSVQK